MKKTLSLVLCALLALSTLAFAAAEEPLEIKWLTIEDANGFWSPDDMTIVALQEKTNTRIDFELISRDSYITSLQTMLATSETPDVVSMHAREQVDMMVDQGALLPLDDLLAEYGENIVSIVGEENYATAAASDGHTYIIPARYITPLTQSWAIRADWLYNCGLEAPATWDEFVAVLEAFKTQDANKNGDPNDEIPLTGIVSRLLFTFGIYNNDIFCVNQAGEYTLIYEHENYRAYLEAMADLYARGLLDPEYLDREKNEDLLVGAMANDLVGVCYTFMNNMHQADELEGEYDYLLPIVGPFGDQHCVGRSVGVTWGNCAGIMIGAEDKAPEIIAMFNWLFGSEGQRLMSYGVEGVSYDLVDGKPVIRPEYADGFVNYRSAGMNYQPIPHVWLNDSYVQVFNGGKSGDELDHVAQQFVYGTQQNEIYAMDFPAVLATEAYTEYYVDLGEQVKSLQANAIAGNITVDEFFAQYETLKAQGLQEVIDQGAAAYAAIAK